MGPISPQTTTALGAELLTVVAKLNRLATQRIGLPLPWAQARLLGTIDDQGEARISDLAELDHCSQPTMTTQVRRLEDAGLAAAPRIPTTRARCGSASRRRDSGPWPGSGPTGPP